MKIFLDDLAETERNSWVPDGWSTARNFTEFKSLIDEALTKGESIEGISFDNDLGEGEKEGWEILKWLYENHPEIMRGNPELKIHSANPEGRRAMEHHITFWQKNYKELIEAKDRPSPWDEIKLK